MEDFTIEFIGSDGRNMHLHQDTELLFVLEGPVRVSLLDKQYILHTDDILVINSNNRHGWEFTGPAGGSSAGGMVCELHFGYRMLREYFDMPLIYFVCNSSTEKSRKYDTLRGILGELMSECAVSQDRPTLTKTSLVYKLVSYLAGYFIADRAVDSGQSEDLRINELLQYINTNHHRTLSLEEMSSLLYISPSSFSRYFKRRTGLTFVKYLNNVRLHFALEDLLYTEAPVTAIAENNGFSNASAFIRAFGEQYGVSPARYRSQHRKGREEKEGIGTGTANQSVPDRADLSAILSEYGNKAAGSLSDPADSSILRINADITKAVPFEEHWCDAIVLGDCSEILTSSFRRQVSEAKALLGFQYAKIEHLFADAMNLRRGHSHHITNYDNLDEVFDFLVSENILPVIGLDNKPWTLPGSVDDLLRDYNPQNIFETLDECLDIVSEMMKHFVTRYGLHEVQNWLFDFWYDEYTDNVLGIKADYPSCFTAVARCIKKHIPGAAVGGCGLSPAINVDHFRALLKNWSAAEMPPDYLSIYLYPYLRIDNIPDGSSPLKKHSEFMNEELENVRRELAKVGWADMPVKVTGWNLSLIIGDSFNDSCGKAAIMLSCMAGALHSVSLAAYESLSDRSASEHLATTLLTGTRGLLTHDGICKPSFFAMQFMSRLLPCLVEKGPHYIITSDGKESFAILCFNEKDMHISYYMQTDSTAARRDSASMFADDASREFIFTLRGLPNGSYSVRQYCVSPAYGSISDIRDGMGNPGHNDDAEDVAYLKRITTPRLLHGDLSADAHRLVLVETLSAHEFRLITIRKND